MWEADNNNEVHRYLILFLFWWEHGVQQTGKGVGMARHTFDLWTWNTLPITDWKDPQNHSIKP